MQGHSGTMVTHLPPISEDGGSNHEPYVGRMVVSYRWSAVYSEEPRLTYVLTSSAHKTTHRDMTYTVLKVMLNSE